MFSVNWHLRQSSSKPLFANTALFCQELGCNGKRQLWIGKQGSGLSCAVEYSSGLNLSELQFLHCKMEIINFIVSVERLVIG